MKPVAFFVGALSRTVALSALLALGLTSHAQAQTDPLPSWNDGAAKQAGSDAPMVCEGNICPQAAIIGQWWCTVVTYLKKRFR